MESKSKKIQMKTNFDGLIYLLADGLYSTKDVFVRELIQNGHDGIIRRQAVTNDPGYQGAVTVKTNPEERTLTFIDNGIGMDDEDIEKFLSVIGSTGTGENRKLLEERFSRDLIGQFGIGLLSAFLVASKVSVLTRKLGNDNAFMWENTGSMDCEIHYDVKRQDVGSTVTVYLKPEYSYLLDGNKLKEIIIKYCDFITVPIRINGTEPVNSIFAPWDKHYPTSEAELDAYQTFINRRFTGMAMDVFPIHIHTVVNGQECEANGVLSISDRRQLGLNSTGILDIFVRKMLVKEGDTSLLPTWAKFIIGVIDSPDLRPTAGRDNVNQEDPAFHAIQKELGNIIIQRLVYLAENREDKFMYINQWHHDHLKGMAFANDEFFEKVGDLLLFRTNSNTKDGLLSLKQYLPKNQPIDGKAPIYYFAHFDGAAQYYRMAEENGICVINAGNRFEEELLEKYGRKHREVILQKLDVLEGGILFNELERNERSTFSNLEFALINQLGTQGKNIIVTTKRFRPEALPVVVIEQEVNKYDEEIANLLSAPGLHDNFGGAFQHMRRRIENRPIQLALNANNRLIQSLAQNLDVLLYEERMQILYALYNNALIYSHYLDEKNRSIVYDGVSNLMMRILELIKERKKLNDALEEERSKALDRNKAKMELESHRPDHILMFMMTPFSDEYKPVEEAVRKVFEQKPFWFEVRLARDYYQESTLVSNVRAHIASAHCFVADISNLSPNVMMEAGAILMSGDERPLFALRSRDAEKAPVDFGDLLTFNYDKRQNSSYAIADNIKQQLFTDGRLANAELEKLLQFRRANQKKRFLSKTILNNIGGGISLPEEVINTICAKYSTIEEFIEADDEILRQIMGTYGSYFTLKGVQDKLKNELKEK